MSSPATAGATSPDHPFVAIKLSIDGTSRRFKLPLKDLVAPVFADKIRTILRTPDNRKLLLERFSDSGDAFVPLEVSNASAYKQLYRAGKAKQKLKLRATLLTENPAPQTQESSSSTIYPESTSAAKEMNNGIAPSLTTTQGRDAFFDQLANVNSTLEDQLSRLMRETHPAAVGGAWQVFCNNCDKPMSDAHHFHCSICDNGDYDLCQACVNSGASCQGEEHWLIKRVVQQDGKVVNSTTETLAPRSSRFTEKPAAAQRKQETPSPIKVHLPAARKVDPATLYKAPVVATRTCNACVCVLPEDHFVNCNDCPDIDYCIPCLKANEHGHNPAHSFQPAVQGAVRTSSNEILELCKPNRNIRHFALCDTCDETIYGVRYKCLTCPDYDSCSKCYNSKTKSSKHAHRFVPVYEPLALPAANETRHVGIFCDGPLCSTGSFHQTYITGIRYKCAVCPDYDLCGNCEAHPSNKHNETHPLIKFKTAVRGVSVQTFEDKPAAPTVRHGDDLPIRSGPSLAQQFNSYYRTSPLTSPPSYSTIPQVKANSTSSKQPTTSPPAQASASFLTRNVNISATTPTAKSAELDATFIKDAVPDGTTFAPDWQFIQTWTLRNPGPNAWPAGVSVRYIGGENMFNLDRARATSVADLMSAQSSNATTKVVQPGEEHVFHVSMRAPANVGQHISYWRMKGPDEIPFGHKLWCHIVVEDNYFPAKEVEIHNQLMQERDAKSEKFSVPSATSEEQTKLLADELREKLEVTATKQATVEDEAESSLRESQMIMPTLERDGTPSASNSMHQDKVAATPAAVETASVVAPEVKAESVPTEDELDDVEFASADGGSLADEEDDDGFLTDEEYDVLDASDEDFRGL